VHRFIAEYRARCTAGATQRRLNSLRAYFQWRRPEDDPTAGIRIAQPRREPKRPYADEELRRLLAACLSARDRALILLLISTGVRRGEVVGLRPEHIDWERGLLLVEGKGQRRRWVAPGTRTMAALRLCANGTGPVWRGRRGNALTRDGLYQVIRRIAERAGVEGAFIHRFRTTWANEFLSQTGDVGSAQVLLGHAKVAQTLAYGEWGRVERALAQMRQHSLADRL